MIWYLVQEKNVLLLLMTIKNIKLENKQERRTGGGPAVRACK